MGISQAIGVSRALYGDGEAKTVVIDFHDEVLQSKITADHPDEVQDVAVDIGVEIKEATLSGTSLTVEFATAPPKAHFNLTAVLLFGKEKHKAEAKHKAPVHGHGHKAHE